jgi:hypothetical protein
LFEDAIDIPIWLEADRQTPFQQRLRRDRELALRLVPHNALASVRGWWRAVPRNATSGSGARLDRLRGLVTTTMAMLGLLAGGAVAFAAFQYDGTHPVNVVRLLALLVALPLALLLLTLLLIPRGGPGLRSIQDALAAVNPGALGAALLRRFAKQPEELARLFDWHASRSPAAARFARWQLLYWSQIAAAAFSAATLATGAALIAFTDLAFGWSTTLAADAGTISRMVTAIARPWQSVVPAAVPNLELIEQSQYFRLDGGSVFTPAASRALTGWWPFTMLAITIYALLPRLILLVAAGARLRAATRALLLADSRVTALLDRMSMPDVETTSTEPTDARRDAAPAPAAEHHELGGKARAVIWSNSIAPPAARDYARRRLTLELTSITEAGGGSDLRADEAALGQIDTREAAPLVLFTPAWEPPLLEFLDFVTALRRRIGSAASIVVLPVPDEPREVTAVERDMWASALAKLGDPHLYVETGAA